MSQNEEDLLIATNNELINGYCHNQKDNPLITKIICANCEKENTIKNSEFLNNFSIHCISKSFSVIDFTCYHCKSQYEMVSCENEYEMEFIIEANKTALQNFSKAKNHYFNMAPINLISNRFVNGEFKNFEINSKIKPGSYSEKELKYAKELSSISEESKIFLFELGMNSMHEIINALIENNE